MSGSSVEEFITGCFYSHMCIDRKRRLNCNYETRVHQLIINLTFLAQVFIHKTSKLTKEAVQLNDYVPPANAGVHQKYVKYILYRKTSVC